MIGETGERKSAVATPDGKSRKKKKAKSRLTNNLFVISTKKCSRKSGLPLFPQKCLLDILFLKSVPVYNILRTLPSHSSLKFECTPCSNMENGRFISFGL